MFDKLFTSGFVEIPFPPKVLPGPLDRGFVVGRLKVFEVLCDVAPKAGVGALPPKEKLNFLGSLAGAAAGVAWLFPKLNMGAAGAGAGAAAGAGATAGAGAVTVVLFGILFWKRLEAGVEFSGFEKNETAVEGAFASLFPNMPKIEG